MGTQPYSAAAKSASDSMPPGYTRPLLATALLIALLGLFFSAGFWQLDRADEKQTILDRFAASAAGNHIGELVPDSAAESLRFRSFKLHGKYLAGRQILLDNMTAGGANGYQVLTPFHTAQGYVLVNRGWIAADDDRSNLPRVDVAANERIVIARLNYLPVPSIRLEQPRDTGNDWPRRLLFPDRQQLERVLGMELPDYQLQLAASEADGYLRDWQAVNSGPEKHLGYALQWFSFAALACIFYLILIYQWWRSRKRATPATHNPT